MKLTPDLIKKAGLFTGKPVKKSIELEVDGEKGEASFYVRPLGYSTVMADFESSQHGKEFMAMRLATSLVDEHDKEIFTYDDIVRMTYDMVVKLWSAYVEVNMPSEKKS